MRIAAYCRVSTDREEQKDSLAHQKEFFLEYAKKNGYELFRLYADDGDIFEPSQKVLTEQAVFLIWSNFLPFWANIHGGAEWATFFLRVILRADAEKPPLY